MHASKRLRAERARHGLGDRSTPHLQVETNRVFKQLSWDIIQKKPLHYAQWVRDTLVQTLLQTVEEPGVRWPAILIALSLPVGLVLERTGPSSTSSKTPRRRERLLALFALGVAFFVVHATTVALVNLPSPRFFYAMVLLLPSVLCGVLFEIWRSISSMLNRQGAYATVIGFALVLVSALVLVPNARHLYRGAVTRTTATAASSWIERNAAFLDHRTIANETSPLGVKARDFQHHILVPLELRWRELSESPASSLDLSDYEVFPQSRLDGPNRNFYAGRIERLDPAKVRTVEAQVFRRSGPTLVILFHPWRVYGGRSQGKVPTLHAVSWRRRTKRRLRTTLPSRFREGQVISLDVSLTPEQVQNCKLTLGGEQLQFHYYRRRLDRPLFMTPRTVLTNEGSDLLFECPNSAKMSPEPAVSVIRWLPDWPLAKP